MSGEQQSDRYLQQLPVKSFAVAQGDVVGGLIYIMNKPAGVEEGMVGISVDSERYCEFVQQQLELLKNGTHPYKQLQERFNARFKRNERFNNLPLKEQIDALLNDKIHLKRRLGISKTDIKKLFSFGKMHEITAFTNYYENVGTGGLLFKQYKKQLKIKKNQHFASQIGKIISDGNLVYMVKQDGIMSLGRTGFGFRRMMKTEIGKTLQIFANPFVVLGTAGLSSLVFAGWGLGFRVQRHLNNKPEDANSGAIVETVSTKIASIRGFTSQDIETIEGTFEDGTPKIATIVGWSSGCRDLSGKLAGGESDKTSVVFAWDNNDQPLRVDNQGNILRTKDKDKEGNITSYEKIQADGTTVSISKSEYEKGTMVSEDRIAGLGEALTSCICLGDRDGIGEYGQNKVIKPINPPNGRHHYQFFGIDFGKAYEGKNNYVGTLSDDFSFVNPTARVKRFLNVSILYDNPLREKMKGIYLMAALRNKLTDEQKEAIAKEYEETDKEFADKLRGYPLSVATIFAGIKERELPKDPALRELWEKNSLQVKNGDLWLIKREENKYRELAATPGTTDKQRTHYLRYADRLSEIYKIARETDDKVFKVFEKRLTLTPSQIDILEGIEKLTADKLFTHSPDGKVQLNHLRVERNDRVPWQLLQNDDGTFNLICESNKPSNEIIKRLKKHPELNALVRSKLDLSSSPLTIRGLSQADLAQLQRVLTEDSVAAARNITTFRTQAMKASFHERLRKNAQLVQAQKQAVTPAMTQTRPTAHPVSAPVITSEIDLRENISTTPASNPEKRKKAVGFGFHATPSTVAPSEKQSVLSQSKMTVKSLKTYLDNAENRQQLAIVDTPKKSSTGGLVLTFKTPEESKEIQAFIDNGQMEDELRYSVNKGLDATTLNSAMRHVCNLAVSTAKPYAEFDISSAPADKRAVLQQIFEELIEKAVQENQFTESSKPKIIGSSLNISLARPSSGR